MPLCTCGGQKRTCVDEVSPCAVRASGIEVGSSGLAADTLAHQQAPLPS